MNIATKQEPAHSANIYAAGDIAEAKRICAHFCFEEGLCVTVTATEFIYTGGRETGFVVGLVNYPRFPPAPQDIEDAAARLATKLIEGLAQNSALIQTPATATWLTRREA